MQVHIENIHLHLPATQRQDPFADAFLASLITPPKREACNGEALPLVGQVWDEQRGVLLGVLPCKSTRRNYALILPLDKAADLGARQWGARDMDITGATCQMDGLANTQAMAASGNKLAQEIIGIEVDGFSGLYLPARHEARMGFLTAADRFNKDKWHWTSTQASSNYAWLQNFNDGDQVDGIKSAEGWVRLVRRFFL